MILDYINAKNEIKQYEQQIIKLRKAMGKYTKYLADGNDAAAYRMLSYIIELLYEYPIIEKEL